MGVFKEARINELRKFANPLDTVTSDYDVIYPVTIPKAVIFPNGTKLSDKFDESGNIIGGGSGGGETVEFASQAEVSAGTVTNRALYPAHVASTANRGTIQIAAQAEVNAFTVANKAVVPATIPKSSTTQQGVIAIATQLEVNAQSAANKAVVPANAVASTTNKGLVQFAAKAELAAGTVDNKAVTPDIVNTFVNDLLKIKISSF
jgi:hypothetical protein